MIHLRHYQHRAIAQVNAAHKAGHQGVLMVAPTGAGKTIIFSTVAHALAAAGAVVLVVVPADELLEQTRDKLRQLGVRHGVIAASYAYNPDPGALVQVGMVQTLRTRPRAMVRTPDYLIFDEAHLSAAESYVMLRERYPLARRLGVTATPWRLDGKGFGDLATEIVVVSTVRDLIREGHLSEFRTYSVPMTDFAARGQAGREFVQAQVAAAYNRNQLVADVVDAWRDYAHQRPSLVFASSIEHSKHLAADFAARAGVVAEHLDGTTPMGLDGDGRRGAPTRRGILERLASGATLVVCNFGVLTAGFDCPRVSAVVVARATASKALWIQMAGRGMRPHADSGKRDCVILDHGGNALRHGNLDALHAYGLDGDGRGQDRGESTGGAGKECPQCRLIVDKPVPVCPQCAYVWARPGDAQANLPKVVAGSLALVESGYTPPVDPVPMRQPVERKADKVERARAWAGMGWRK